MTVLNDADRESLKPGDRVLVRMDDKTLLATKVRTRPWRLGHGTWVVGLDGRAGGYLLDRVEEKVG